MIYISSDNGRHTVTKTFTILHPTALYSTSPIVITIIIIIIIIIIFIIIIIIIIINIKMDLQEVGGGL